MNQKDTIINPKFIHFNTNDGLKLPGLLYQPASKTKKVIIYLHGNGSSSIFYSKKTLIFGNILNQKNISFFTFNNRGAHYIKKLDQIINKKVERKKYGMAYEIIKECVIDIDSAIAYLSNLGYQQFYLAGSSTGANKICVYHHYQSKNIFKKYILIAGGDDTGIYYHLLGRKKFFSLLNQSKKIIKSKKGSELITELMPEIIFSYRSFYDTCNPDGDYNCFPFLEKIKNLKLSKKPLFRYYCQINKPTLVIYGDQDEYCWGNVYQCVDILKSYQPEFDYQIKKGADHSFDGYEKKIINRMIDFIN